MQFHAGVGFAVAILSGLLWRFGLQDPRKKRYLDFYKTYDAKKDFERMQKAGIFQSVNPDGSARSID